MYWIQNKLLVPIKDDYEEVEDASPQHNLSISPSLELGECRSDNADINDDDEQYKCDGGDIINPSTVNHDETSRPFATFSASVHDFYTNALRAYNDDDIPNGSNHGLSSESIERVKWVHRIPWYAKPAIPSGLNLIASALRWTALVYIDASVAEMMIAGLELSLSVVAARIFRKRIVAKVRWVGVVLVAFGVIIIERANSSRDESSSDNVHGTKEVMIGVVLILVQSVLSVLQDLAEEIFMQAADFPATMMLGIEGIYGFVVGALIYSTVGGTLGMEDIDTTMSMLSKHAELRWWLAGLPVLFLITGLFNIEATKVTSAMTRNIWKTMRTVMVWSIALAIYYLGSNASFGEAWHTPESFVILFGFSVMSAGIITYYSLP